MTDQWVPSGPLVPANEWGSTCGCTPVDGPAIADSVVIKGSPGAITSVQNNNALWALVLNDGTPAADFRIDRFDNAGLLADSPMTIVRATGVVSFHDPVMLAADPVQPFEAATKEYVDAIAGGIPDAPMDNQTYGRDNGAWVALPASYMPEAPNNSIRYGRFNSVWQADAIQTDAPGDGAAYGRAAGNWSTVLATTGGTITGNLTVTGILTVNGSNSVALSDSAGGQRAILGQTGTLTRWQMILGDQAAESLPANGSNFTLNACNNLGTVISTPFAIRRSDGMAAFGGPVNMNAGGAVNGTFALQGPGSLILPGGVNGQVLTTNGAGVLSWAAGASVSVGDTAPASPKVGDLWWDSVGGQLYVRYQDPNTTQWVPATNASSFPPPASTTVLGSVKVDGTSIKAAPDGTISTVLVPMGDNRVINGDMRIDQRNNGAAGTASGYTVDRWIYSATASSNYGTWQRAVNNAGGQAACGFGYFLSFTSSSAHVSAAADYSQIVQIIEADFVADFAWGTPQAQPVTLSFWVVSSLTGTFSGSIRNYAGTRSYPFIYSIPVPNTWTKIAITIPGETTGSWVLQGNAGSVVVGFDLGSGSNSRGAAGAWAATGFLCATGAQSIIAVNGASFGLTGVKLEIGSVATPFNRQSLAKSLADCQRYFQNGQIATFGWGGAGQGAYSASAYVVTPRASPTITVITNNNANFTLSSWAAGLVPTAVGTVPTAGAYTINLSFTASAEL